MRKKALKADKKTFERERTDQFGLQTLETFDSKTRKLLKRTNFYEDDKTISSIIDYDSKTGKVIRWTRFDQNWRHKIRSRKPIA